MKVALTGGASGIGRAVAKRMQRDGHHITAFDIKEPDGDIDAWIGCDMSDAQSISRALDTAEGPFDVLINNAGVPPRDGMAELVLNVNFIGFRQFLTGMLDKLAPGASIVNTASRAGAMWRENLDQVKRLMALTTAAELRDFIAAENIDPTRAYNLSKEAVIALTLAETEAVLARGLRMNSVSPAAVSTGILDDFLAAFGPQVSANIKRVGRAGEPEEIADVIAFFASPESRWLKGVDVVVDGGMGAVLQTSLLGLTSRMGDS